MKVPTERLFVREQMKNKKILAIVAVVVVLVLLGVLIFFGGNKNSETDADESGITKYEWLKMLCTQTGMGQGDLWSPVFEDVDRSNNYFSYVQAAANWGLLNDDDVFSGEAYASGEFIAMTTMKAFGEKKIQIYLDTDQEISDKQYLQLALELELMKKDNLKKGVTTGEARQILEKYQELYYGELWPENYEKINYQDNVMELGSGDILWGDAYGTEMVVNSTVGEQLQRDSIIVYDGGNGEKTFRRVVNINEEDQLRLGEEVQLEEILQEYMLYSTESVSFEDIVSYYGLEEDDKISMEPMLFRKKETDETKESDTEGEKVTSPEFKLLVSTKRNETTGVMELHIKIKGEIGGAVVTYELPNHIRVNDKTEWEIELNVGEINVKAAVDYRNGELNGGEVHVDTNINTSAKIKMEEEVKKKLFTVPVKLAGGICKVDVELYLVISADGKISLQAQFPVGGGVCYEKERGLRYCSFDIHAKDPEVEAESDVGFIARVEPVLKIFKWNAMDAEIDVGLHWKYVVTERTTMICTDSSISFPTLKLAAAEDEEKGSLLRKYLKKKNISVEWEIISEENAPIVKNWHWEEIPPADKQLVEECTYSKTNDTLPGSDQNANINRNPNTDQRLTPLFGKDIPAYFFVQEILDNGENYTIRGDVYVRDYIEKDRFDTLQPGDTVNSLQGEAYTVESIGNLLVNDPVVIELEKDGEKWYCCKAQEYQFYQFPNTLEGNVAYLPLSTEEEFVGYSQYVSAHAKEAAYEAQGQDVPDEILEITESGPYWAGDDKYTIEDVELTVDKDMPVYDAILGYSYSRKEVEDVIGEYPDMHMYEEGMSFAEAYAADEIQKAQTFSSRFSIVGFYLTGQGNLDLLFSLQFPD